MLDSADQCGILISINKEKYMTLTILCAVLDYDDELDNPSFRIVEARTHLIDMDSNFKASRIPFEARCDLTGIFGRVKEVELELVDSDGYDVLPDKAAWLEKYAA
jgi:hypothetical protein